MEIKIKNYGEKDESIILKKKFWFNIINIKIIIIRNCININYYWWSLEAIIKIWRWRKKFIKILRYLFFVKLK